jgi:single-strand DNA-binding protein
MFIKLVRIGRDAELRYTPNQKAVINLACVYDVGWGDNKKPQWIDATVWGKQAEALAEYLLKGKQIVISADDLEVEEYQTKGGALGAKLKCRVIDISLTDSGQGQQEAPQGQQMPSQQLQQKRQQPVQQGGFQQAQQGFAQQQAHQQGGYSQQGQQNQQAKVNPQEPLIDFDDDIPF